MNRQHREDKPIPYLSLTVFLAFVLTLPRVFSHGMFIDGQIYAVLARNLVDGVGTFWIPSYTEEVFQEFYEHPPLAFSLQSLWFWLFGDHYLVEKIASFTNWCCSALIIVIFWRQLIFQNHPVKKHFWMPLLFWILIPKVTWAASNNTLENTLNLFTLLAVYLQLAAVNSRYRTIYSILAGFAVFAGCLTKGLVALFPLAVYPLYALCIPHRSKIQLARNWFVVLAVTIGSLSLLLQLETPRHSIMTYWSSHLAPALTTGREAARQSHWWIINRLFSELLPGIILLILLLLISRRKNRQTHQNAQRQEPMAFLMLAIGLSASVPLMISLKQSAMYILPAFPYFALGFAAIAAKIRPANHIPIIRNNSRIIGYGAWILVGLAFLIPLLRYDSVSRDHEMVNDILTFTDYLDPGLSERIGLCPDMKARPSLHGYLARYYRANLVTTTESTSLRFFLTDRQCDQEKLTGYNLLTPNNSKYLLWEKVSQ